jgi:hypothetical protein
VAHERHIEYRHFVGDQKVCLQGMAFVARKNARGGLNFEQAADFALASTPVATKRRLAARPVGARRRHRTFLARRISRPVAAAQELDLL